VWDHVIRQFINFSAKSQISRIPWKKTSLLKNSYIVQYKKRYFKFTAISLRYPELYIKIKYWSRSKHPKTRWVGYLLTKNIASTQNRSKNGKNEKIKKVMPNFELRFYHFSLNYLFSPNNTQKKLFYKNIIYLSFK